MGVCNCSMFCCTLLYVHSNIEIILMWKRELVALLDLSTWCLVMVERLVLAVPWGCLRFVIVLFSDHTHLLFFIHSDAGCYTCAISSLYPATREQMIYGSETRQLSKNACDPNLGKYGRGRETTDIYNFHWIYNFH